MQHDFQTAMLARTLQRSLGKPPIDIAAMILLVNANLADVGDLAEGLPAEDKAGNSLIGFGDPCDCIAAGTISWSPIHS